MNTPIEKEKAVREALSPSVITQKNPHQPYLSIGIFSSLALLLLLTALTLINPHLFWNHSVVINDPLHSTMETIGAVSAILMAFLSLEIFTEKINPSYVFISLGFLAMGIWDMFHAIVYPGNGFVLTHSLAMLSGGLFFFFSMFPAGKTIIRKKGLAFFLTAVFFVSSAVSTILFRDYLPQMVGDGGEFTGMADSINVAAGILFLITAAKLAGDYYRHRALEITILIFVATLSALAGLTFHYSYAWTYHWWFWHVLRLCAHVSLLVYLLVEFFKSMKERSSAVLLFEQKTDELTASEQKLKALNQQLMANQQRLIEEKERFETLFDSEPDAIFIADPDTGILIDANQAAVDLTGYPTEKLVGMHQSLLHPEEMRKMFADKFRDIALKGSRKPQEAVIENADGKRIPVEVVGNVVKVAGKKIVIGIFRDITARKELEKQKETAFKALAESNEKLKIQEKRFRSIFENSPVGKSITGLDGSLQLNESFCRMLGYSSEELKNMKWEKITYPEDVAESSEIVKSLLDGEKTQAHFNKRYVHKNGHIVWTDVRTTLFRDRDGTPRYFITTVADITKQKEAEKNILRQQQLTDSILDSLPGIFYQIDTEGHYKRWNRKFLEVTGYIDEEMQTINAVDFFRGKDITDVVKAMERVFMEGEAQVEADLTIKSGESIPYLFTGIQFEIEGNPYILGMGLDISNLKSIQDELTRTVKELEIFNKMAVGRELRMIELKAKINSLSRELGKKAPYDLQFAEQDR